MAEPVDHAERSHSVWSASATERNWNCAGALALTTDLPETTSEAADWGTCAHQISEKCFANGNDAVDYIGTTEKGKKHEFVVDDEMADTAQMYVDYVRGRMAEYKATTGKNAILFIEEKFSLADLQPPFEAGGTSDAVMYFPLWEMIEVVDLKGGRGVLVEVEGNKQGRSYGLGVALKHQSYKAKKIKVTIVQPRIWHKDGRIRSDDFDIIDLLEWTTELVDKMHVSHDAYMHKREFDLSTTADAMAPAEWAATYLKPGPWCEKTFCGAAGFCPALEKVALDKAGVWFDDLDQPRLANTPDSEDPAIIARDLDACDLVEMWAKARRALGHAKAESGIEIPGYVLVETEGREKFKDEAAVISSLTAAGVPAELFLNPAKAKTPKQVRAELAKKKHGMADKLALLENTSATPTTGRALVRADKTSKPAAMPAATKHFVNLDETNLFD